MTTDLEVARSIWNGRIPIAFHLAGDEPRATNVTPYFLLAPRGAYLTLCSDKVRLHFQRPVSSTPDEDEVWFDYKGLPLRWNVPVGVLYDCHAAQDGLPWEITTHFSNFPPTIMRCPGTETIESAFLSTVKEANYLKHGTCQIEGLQSQEDKKQLWLGLAQDDFDQFRRIFAKLQSCKDGHWYKQVPFRLYVVETETESPVMIEEPFPTVNLEGSPTTLDDILDHFLPEAAVRKVLIHGVEPDRATPLQWLSEHCVHPDNFLHVVVFVAAPSTELAAS